MKWVEAASLPIEEFPRSKSLSAPPRKLLLFAYGRDMIARITTRRAMRLSVSLSMISMGLAHTVVAQGSDHTGLPEAERRENVLTAGAAVGIVFPGRRAVVGVGPGVGYERALSRDVGIAVGCALAVIPDGWGVAGSAGISIPLYVVGDAPSGFFVAPGLAIAFGEYDLGFGGGLSIGYQHVFSSGFTLGVSAGPALTYTDLGYYPDFGAGLGVAAGYSF